MRAAPTDEYLICIPVLRAFPLPLGFQLHRRQKTRIAKLSIIIYQILDNVFTNLRLWPSPSTSLSCRVNEPAHTLDAFPVHSVSHWAYGPVPYTRQAVE